MANDMTIQQEEKELNDYQIAVDYENDQQLFFIFPNIDVKQREPFNCPLDFILNPNLCEGQQLKF